ncbi:MaoC family dehydratase [Halomarina ordinaria]|uniref:MaoC family dehydratase n=1 Tax=Halomarina ordinaria TaxID=3033939 RepID=A0ABD5U9N4_9EURY|nr:MaoC family dehydratase [Halomarina sp. PSRA2]
MSTTSNPFLTTWTRTSEQLLNSVLAANRATAAAFGVPVADAEGTAVEGTTAEGRLRPGEDLAEWDSEVSADSREALSVGDVVRFSKTLTERDIERFAAASGDTNRIHLDADYAAKTRFDGRIAHGTLVSGLISAALARLPGNVIYLSQDVQFLKPVRIGDRVTADVEVAEDFDDGRYRLTTRVLDEDEEAVIDGEAVVLIDAAPE